MKKLRAQIALGILAAATLALVTLGGGDASAEDKPMVLTVRPSGYEKLEDPRARQEKLMKRLEQSGYWVRSICSQCGDSWKHQVYAPFNPLEALGQKRTSEEPMPAPTGTANAQPSSQ